MMESTQGAAVVPALDAASSLACVRSLGRRGVPVVVLSNSLDEYVLSSKYVSEVVAVPDPNTEYTSYRDAVVDVLKRPSVETFLPLRPVDVHVLAENWAEVTGHASLPVASPERVRTATDRERLFDAAERAGVDGPATALLDEWDDWDRRTVVKSRHGILVEGDRSFYHNPEFFAAGERPDEDALVAAMEHVPIVQEYVPGGPEQGFFALFDDGEPVATFQHHRVRSYSYYGGASVYRKSVADDDLERAGLRLLRHLDWHGPAMVEFRRDDDGVPQLIEVNPRFWGSLPLAVCAGVDFPWLYYQLARGDDPTPVHDYRVGVGCHTLVGELVYLDSVLTDHHPHVEPPSLSRAAGEVVASLVTDPQFDVLSAGDPAPFAAQARELFDDALERGVP